MTSDFHIDIDQYMPLREVVFTTLRQAILKGELQPGERLMEISLAKLLGVSRTPIREAIRKLELEGLVVMVPRKGAHVAHITEKELNDVLEVRLGLEELAIKKACERITEEELVLLEEAAETFSGLMTSGNLIELAEADVKFHDVIYAATHNERLVQLLNNLREQMYRYRMEYLKDENSRILLDEEHKEICRAVRAGDFEKAHRYTCQHIDNQQRGIVKILKEDPNKK